AHFTKRFLNSNLWIQVCPTPNQSLTKLLLISAPQNSNYRWHFKIQTCIQQREFVALLLYRSQHKSYLALVITTWIDLWQGQLGIPCQQKRIALNQLQQPIEHGLFQATASSTATRSRLYMARLSVIAPIVGKLLRYKEGALLAK